LRATIEFPEAPFLDGILDGCGGIDCVRRSLTPAHPHLA
jgi:hypothetical protein